MAPEPRPEIPCRATLQRTQLPARRPPQSYPVGAGGSPCTHDPDNPPPCSQPRWPHYALMQPPWPNMNIVCIYEYSIFWPKLIFDDLNSPQNELFLHDIPPWCPSHQS